MRYLGIDPGKSGGIAIVGDIGEFPRAECWKMPETERDVSDLVARIAPRVSAAFVELVGPRPLDQAGTIQMFKFGMSYGFIRGLITAFDIPVTYVRPQQWQKVLSCLCKGDKNITKARAQQLFPSLKGITHATADALLIAEYGRITLLPTTTQGHPTASWDSL